MALRVPIGSCESFHWSSDASVIDLVLHSRTFKDDLAQARILDGLYSTVGEQIADAFFPSRGSTGGCGSGDAYDALKALAQQGTVRLYARISDENGRLVVVPLGLLAMFVEGGQNVFANDIQVYQPIARQSLETTQCVKDWTFVLPSQLDGLDPSDPRLVLPTPLGGDSRVIRSRADFITRFVDVNGLDESPSGLLLLAHHEDGRLTFSGPTDSMGYNRFDKSLGVGSIAIVSACETANLTDSTKLINRLNDNGVDALVVASFELDVSFGIDFAYNFAQTIAEKSGKTVTLDQAFREAIANTVTVVTATTSHERARGMSLELIVAGNPNLSICPEKPK